ncbi:hypothetical protein L3Q82_010882 [Scortum barcoo]|uniref:Uncharacterized protein n=1 Tax=Scortum barcoo TaxID=214431 RepID=A0ACB8W878_9TELE|nr:hypothetical protein L3Q82_010882 [Scortum barcoo]
MDPNLYHIIPTALLTDVEYTVDVELNVTDVETVDYLRSLLNIGSFSLALGPTVNVTHINITTVCYLNGTSFQCRCEDQYRWSRDQCFLYGSCDSITDDTCGCINTFPPDGHYCQPVDEHICYPNGTTFQCRCEEQYSWPCHMCSTFGRCDDTSDNTCGCLNAIPPDGVYCQALSDDLFVCPSPVPPSDSTTIATTGVNATVTVTPTMIVTDSTTVETTDVNATVTTTPTTMTKHLLVTLYHFSYIFPAPSVLYEYIISVELNTSDVTVVNELRTILGNITYPISVNDQIQIYNVNMTTVCYPNGTTFQCRCEEQYSWPCHMCSTFGRCDDTSDNTCGCLNAIPPDGVYCQALSDDLFVCPSPVPPSDSTTIATTGVNATVTVTPTMIVTDSTPITTTHMNTTTPTMSPTTPSVLYEYIISVELNTSDVTVVNELRTILGNITYPISVNDQIQIYNVNMTTVCYPNGTTFQCRCEEQYSWPCHMCSTFGRCDDTSDNTCGCLNAIPPDGVYCQALSDDLFVCPSPVPPSDSTTIATTGVNATVTVTPTMIVTDSTPITTTHMNTTTPTMSPTTPSVLHEYIISVELNTSDVTVVNELRTILGNITYPISVNDQIQIYNVNITTVCYPNGTTFQCRCEEQYSWPCHMCSTFGRCDDTSDNTCGCLNAIPPDGVYCQAMSDDLFVCPSPVPPSDSRTIATTGVNATVTVTPTMIVTDSRPITTTHMNTTTPTMSPTTPLVLYEYIISVELNTSDVTVVNELRTILGNITYPISVNDQIQIYNVNMTTVCYPNGTTFQCRCEEQYSWPCHMCSTFGRCDDTSDNTCGCLNAIPPDGVYCQALSDDLFVCPSPVPPSASTSLATTPTTPPTTTAINVTSPNSTVSPTTTSLTTTSVPTTTSTVPTTTTTRVTTTISTTTTGTSATSTLSTTRAPTATAITTSPTTTIPASTSLATTPTTPPTTTAINVTSPNSTVSPTTTSLTTTSVPTTTSTVPTTTTTRVTTTISTTTTGTSATSTLSTTRAPTATAITTSPTTTIPASTSLATTPTTPPTTTAINVTSPNSTVSPTTTSLTTTSVPTTTSTVPTTTTTRVTTTISTTTTGTSATSTLSTTRAPTATAITTSPTTTIPGLNVEMSIRLDKKYTAELSNITSSAYKDLESRINKVLVEQYKGVTGFIGAFVRRFREGSLITDFVVQTTYVHPDEVGKANERLIEAMRPIAPVLEVTASHYSTIPLQFPNLTYTGSTMTLTCEPPKNINMGNISSFKWKFKGREIKESERIAISVTNMTSVLTIKNVILPDVGLYECTLSGRVMDFIQKGNATTDNIKQAPIVRLQHIVNVKCEDGKMQSLECCVQSSYKVKWFRGTEALSFSNDDGDEETYCIIHEYKLEGCSGQQQIKNQFTCRVVKPLGYEMTTTVIIFNENIVCDDAQYGTGRADDLSRIRCNKGQEGSKTAICQKTGKWRVIEDTCIITHIKELLIASQDLAVDEVPELVANLSKIVQEDKTKIVNSSATVSAIVDILSTIANTVANIITAHVSESVMKNVLETVDVIIGEDTREAWVVLNANETSNTSSVLLGSLETLSNELVGEFAIITQWIMLNRTKFDYSFKADLNSSIFIDIPKTNQHNVFITTITFSTLNYVMPARNSSFDVSLFNATSNETVIHNAINAAVVLVQINATIQNVTLTYNKLNKELSLNPQCVFWNFTLFNDLGAWDDKGCIFVSDINNMVTCSCNHLTSFSILMAKNIPPELKDALDIITYVGVGISLASLVICLIIEGYVWKAITRNSTAFMRHVSIINTALSLLIADICFIIGASVAKNPLENPGEDYGVPVGPCSTATFFMHFFYLALFFWMLVSGLLLFYRTVMVFSHMSKSTMLAIGFSLGYGCPLIIAVITVAVTAPVNGYIRRTDGCWLNWIETKALLALVIPALIIVFINILIVIVVLFKMLRRGVGDTAQTDEKHTLVVIARCVIILTPLFGLTWSLGVGTMVSSTDKGIHIAFAFFNSLQGFFILVFGTLFDSKVC